MLIMKGLSSALVSFPLFYVFKALVAFASLARTPELFVQKPDNPKPVLSRSPCLCIVITGVPVVPRCVPPLLQFYFEHVSMCVYFLDIRMFVYFCNHGCLRCYTWGSHQCYIWGSHQCNTRVTPLLYLCYISVTSGCPTSVTALLCKCHRLFSISAEVKCKSRANGAHLYL